MKPRPASPQQPNGLSRGAPIWFNAHAKGGIKNLKGATELELKSSARRPIKWAAYELFSRSETVWVGGGNAAKPSGTTHRAGRAPSNMPALLCGTSHKFCIQQAGKIYRVGFPAGERERNCAANEIKIEKFGGNARQSAVDHVVGIKRFIAAKMGAA